MESWNSAVAHDLYAPLQGVLPIRLLELFPGGASEPLRCRLISTTIGEAQGQYEATSYTWGSPANPQTIDCNGVPLKIQQNAFDMLSHLRQRDRPCTVWIDAICINQGDTPERSSQVSAMHLVYSFAKSVVIWLGCPDQFSTVAMKFAASLDATEFMQEHAQERLTTMEPPVENRRKTCIFEPGANRNIHLSREIITASVNFICRPWFGRVWVLQEAAGCRETRILCGHDEILWQQLFSLAWIMRSEGPGQLPSYLPDSYSLVQRNAFAVLKMHDIRCWRFPYSGRDSHFRTDFGTVLSSAHLHEATDPSDKIYSAMNLSMDRDIITDLERALRHEDDSSIIGYANWGLKVDYNIPWEVLYAHVSLELLKRGYITSLSDSGRIKQKQPVDLQLPSWVVDFREQPTSSEMHENSSWKAGGRCRGPTPISNAQSVVKVGVLPKAHRRALDVSLMSEKFEKFNTSNHSLKPCLNSFVSLLTLMRDEIIWTGRVCGDDVTNAQPISQRILGFIKQELGQAKSAPTTTESHYITGESLLSAYQLTLILGMDNKLDSVDAAFVQSEWEPFISYLKTPTNDKANSTNAEQLHLRYELATASSAVWFDMRFAITAHGYFCLVPAMVRPGDTAVVVRAHHMPLFLRPYVSPRRKARPGPVEYFESIGGGYVHGMMDNEAKCIVDEFGYKANMTEVRRRELEEKRWKNGDVWRELGFGDYGSVVETIGPAWVNVV